MVRMMCHAIGNHGCVVVIGLRHGCNFGMPMYHDGTGTVSLVIVLQGISHIFASHTSTRIAALDTARVAFTVLRENEKERNL